jgi:molybdenum cofactor cytidylyltransferase
MTRIALIVLAAGTSERFGTLDKLATPIGGRSLLAWSLDASADARIASADRLVVIGHGSAVATRIAESHGWRTTFAHDAARGMGASLRAGLAAVDDEVVGAVVVLGDDPLAARMLPDVLAAALAAPDAVVAVRRTPFLPHPVYLPRGSWPAPDAPVSDHGLRDELGSDVTWLEDAGVHPVDVDTQDDVTRLRAAMSVD